VSADRHRLVDWLRDLACLAGFHVFWDAGQGEFVCVDCGKTISAPTDEERRWREPPRAA
jgi:hypothetical protein